MLMGRGGGGDGGESCLTGPLCDHRWGHAVWEGAEETKGRGKSPEALELLCWVREEGSKLL